jgi:amidase
VVRAILSQNPWLHDPLVVELPWRDDQERFILDIANSGGGKQLAFGIMIDDGTVQPHPPVRRALDIVVKTIQRLGHRIIEWKPPSHKKGLTIAVGCLELS